ncbi:MAG: TolC family protein, partial [Delftia sp.]|nr:TolC family protein [Delftia sp.]
MSFPSSFPSRTASHAPWSAWPGPRALLVMAVLTACGAVQAGEPADA